MTWHPEMSTGSSTADQFADKVLGLEPGSSDPTVCVLATGSDCKSYQIKIAW